MVRTGTHRPASLSSVTDATPFRHPIAIQADLGESPCISPHRQLHAFATKSARDLVRAGSPPVEQPPPPRVAPGEWPTPCPGEQSVPDHRPRDPRSLPRRPPKPPRPDGLPAPTARRRAIRSILLSTMSSCSLDHPRVPRAPRRRPADALPTTGCATSTTWSTRSASTASSRVDRKGATRSWGSFRMKPTVSVITTVTS